MLLDQSQSFLLVVDVQEKLAPAIHEIDRVVDNIERLIKAARICEIPTYATEHCPDRIGRTVERLRKRIDPGCIEEKQTFAATRETRIANVFDALHRPQVVISGTEAHVCVLQSATVLQESGKQVYLVADATSSRHPENRSLAIERLRQTGAEVVSTEMVIFEWLERGDSNRFRELLPVIKGS